MSGIFSKAKNVDAAFRQVKMFALLVVVACVVLTSIYIYFAERRVSMADGRVLILLNGKVVDAMVSSRKDNVEVEAKDHVSTFHEHFFTLSPDEEFNKANVNKALYLADRSAKTQYDNLMEANYYGNLISANISQRILIDSVSIDLNQYPYYFRCTARQEITRPTNIVIRSLVTEGYLRNVARSINNSHGLLVEKWRILENKDVSTKSR